MMATNRKFRVVRTFNKIAVIAAYVALPLISACATSQPAIKVEYREVLKEVQRPCPVTKPVIPDKLARPLPKDAGRLVDLLVAKLTEWAGPGGYGERANAAIETCTKP